MFRSFFYLVLLLPSFLEASESSLAFQSSPSMLHQNTTPAQPFMAEASTANAFVGRGELKPQSLSFETTRARSHSFSEQIPGNTQVYTAKELKKARVAKCLRSAEIIALGKKRVCVKDIARYLNHLETIKTAVECLKKRYPSRYSTTRAKQLSYFKESAMISLHMLKVRTTYGVFLNKHIERITHEHHTMQKYTNYIPNRERFAELTACLPVYLPDPRDMSRKRKRAPWSSSHF